MQSNILPGKEKHAAPKDGVWRKSNPLLANIKPPNTPEELATSQPPMNKKEYDGKLVDRRSPEEVDRYLRNHILSED